MTNLAAGAVDVSLRGNDLFIIAADPEVLDALPHALVRAMHRDARAGGYRLAALHLPELERALGDAASWRFDPRPPLPYDLNLTMHPRPYQAEALASWRAAG